MLINKKSTFKIFMVLNIIALLTISTNCHHFPGFFINLGMIVNDLGVSSEGDCCVIGVDDAIYCYDMMDDEFIKVSTESIRGLSRIDVNADGTIYVSSICGTYYLNCENQWIKLPGGTRDIGVGKDLTVWKIGNDIRKIRTRKTTGINCHNPNTFRINYGVWKLICSCKCLCLCRRQCIRFRVRDYDPCLKEKEPYCYWFRTDGYGRKIDVFPNGDAIFTVNHSSRSHTTLKWVNHHGMYMRDYKCGIYKMNFAFANDVTVGNNGVVYVTLHGPGVYRGLVYKCHRNRRWRWVVPYARRFIYSNNQCKTDNTNIWYILFADNISAGPYNQFWFNHHRFRFYAHSPQCYHKVRKALYTSSRFRYLDNMKKQWTITSYNALKKQLGKEIEKERKLEKKSIESYEAEAEKIEKLQGQPISVDQETDLKGKFFKATKAEIEADEKFEKKLEAEMKIETKIDEKLSAEMKLNEGKIDEKKVAKTEEAVPVEEEEEKPKAEVKTAKK